MGWLVCTNMKRLVHRWYCNDWFAEVMEMKRLNTNNQSGLQTIKMSSFVFRHKFSVVVSQYIPHNFQELVQFCHLLFLPAIQVLWTSALKYETKYNIRESTIKSRNEITKEKPQSRRKTFQSHWKIMMMMMNDDNGLVFYIPFNII